MPNLFEYADLLDHQYECFTEDHSTRYEVGLHWHYFMEIMYIMEGEIYVHVGNREYTAKPGDLVVLLPSVLHSISTASTKTVYSVIKFSPGNASSEMPYGSVGWKESALLSLASSSRNIRAHFPAEMVKETRISLLIEHAQTEMDTKKTGYLSAIRSLLQIVLIELIRIWQQEGLELETFQEAETDSLNVESVPAYIDERLGEPLRVEELAELCNLSYSQFSKKFHRLFGRSCKQYIEYVRLEKAAELLTTTSMDINAISQETGFADASHMIRCFKNRYGCTPKKYRG